MLQSPPSTARPASGPFSPRPTPGKHRCAQGYGASCQLALLARARRTVADKQASWPACTSTLSKTCCKSVCLLGGPATPSCCSDVGTHLHASMQTSQPDPLCEDLISCKCTGLQARPLVQGPDLHASAQDSQQDSQQEGPAARGQPSHIPRAGC